MKLLSELQTCEPGRHHKNKATTTTVEKYIMQIKDNQRLTFQYVLTFAHPTCTHVSECVDCSELLFSSNL